MTRLVSLIPYLALLLAGACGDDDGRVVTTHVTIQMGDAYYRIPFLDDDRAGPQLTGDNNLNVQIRFDWSAYRRRSPDEEWANWLKYELNEIWMSVDYSEYLSVSDKAGRVLSWYDEWEEKPSPAGLMQMIPASGPNPSYFKPSNNEFADFHVYYKASSFGEISDFVECLNDRRAQRETYRWCSHSFHSRGFYWTIQYDVRHLENWRLLKSEAINRFDSWKVEDPEPAGLGE